MRRTFRPALVALFLAALLGGGLSPAARAAEDVPGTVPPPLTDDRGRILTLRGWNVEDKTHRGDDALSAITERHFRDLHARGFNFARLLVFWDDLEPRRGQYSHGYLDRIEQILDWARSHGIHVVLDAHQDVFGPAFGHRGVPEWATRTDGLPFTPHPDDWFSEYFEPAVQRAFTHLYEDEDLRAAQARMWRLLAGRFGNHPALLGYDLINEPMGELREGEDLVTAADRIEAEQLTPMYRRLARAVRSQDRAHWLFIEPTPIVGEGVPTGLGGIGDPKAVYSPHFYDTAMEAGADYDPSAGWIEAYEAAVTAYPARWRMPVVVGEWGPPNSSLPHMARFYDDALASLARYSSGWAGYVWCYDGGYCALDADGRFRTNKGKTATPYASAVAGTVRDDRWAPATARYRLAYRAQLSEPTKVSLPPGPRGWRIRVSGHGAWASATSVPPGRSAVVRVRAPQGAEVRLTAVPATNAPGSGRS